MHRITLPPQGGTPKYVVAEADQIIRTESANLGGDPPFDDIQVWQCNGFAWSQLARRITAVGSHDVSGVDTEVLGVVFEPPDNNTVALMTDWATAPLVRDTPYTSPSFPFNSYYPLPHPPQTSHFYTLAGATVAYGLESISSMPSDQLASLSYAGTQLLPFDSFSDGGGMVGAGSFRAAGGVLSGQLPDYWNPVGFGLWLRLGPPLTSGERVVLQLSNNTSAFKLSFNGTGLQISAAAGSIIGDPGTVAEGQWHFLEVVQSFVFPGITAAALCGYLDGTLVTELEISSPIEHQMDFNSQSLCVGALCDGTLPLDGHLADLQVYVQSFPLSNGHCPGTRTVPGHLVVAGTVQ